jgi:hypothetical protein
MPDIIIFPTGDQNTIQVVSRLGTMAYETILAVRQQGHDAHEITDVRPSVSDAQWKLYTIILGVNGD